MKRTIATRLVVCLLSALAGAATAAENPLRFDNWVYYTKNFNGSAQWEYDPRLLVPFAFGNGWTFTQRIDIPFYYTDKVGSANPQGAWSFGLSDAFVEEIFDTPDLMLDFRPRVSVRVVAPTGGAAPFGQDQWQVAPGAGFTWQLPDVGRGMTVSPYLRYFIGFDAQTPGVTTVRSVNVIPTVTFAIAGPWSVSLYPEKGLQYNARTKQWFVPFEAMVLNRVSNTLEFAIGGAYAIVRDDPSYRWLVEARLSCTF